MELYVAFCVDSGYRIFALHKRPEKALGAEKATGVWPLVLYMLMQSMYPTSFPASLSVLISVPAEDSDL